MRVAIVSESFLPTLNGVTTSVAKVLEHLRDSGHDATLIVPAAGAPKRYAGFEVREIAALPYRQFPVGLPNPFLGALLADFEPDVLHAASPFLLGGQAIATARRMGLPSVAVYQTDIPAYARSNRLRATERLATRIVKWIHDTADLTLAPSSAAIATLQASGVERIAHWGRGVDLELYHPRHRMTAAGAELRARLSPDGVPLVGYVGRLAPEKSVERFAELRGLPVRIVIVGDGPSSASVDKALRGMDVVRRGSLTGVELATAYAAFDVFAHTGTQETFGQTIQEAHASGLPVIAPRVGGPIDLVTHGVDGMLFQPGDGSFRAAVAALADDDIARARLGEAGRRRVLGRSWSHLGAELVDHYAGAIVTRAVSGPPPVGAPRVRRPRTRGTAGVGNLER